VLGVVVVMVLGVVVVIVFGAVVVVVLGIFAPVAPVSALGVPYVGAAVCEVCA
jgi:hypothetical protein